MFWHCLKYELLTSIRAKDLIIWLMIFPIALGTLFKIAFGSVYETQTKFSTVKTAVVETTPDPVLHQVLDSIGEQEDAFMSVKYVDEDEAMDLLKNEKVEGIIFADGELSLTVHYKGMNSTILTSFVENYNSQRKIIMEAAKNDPASLNDVTAALSAEVNTCREVPLTDGNTDNLIQYFYNLIAMVAMFGSLTGLHITINNQANLSAVGSRNNCSPAPKSVSILAALTGSYIVQGFCMALCVTYLRFVLKIDFGSRLPLVYAAALLGGIAGVSMGFFVGSLNRMKIEAKTSILMSVSMICCFLSGLMVGNMKGVIIKKAPWFNHVNPAALVSDSFYCLNIYSDYRRFMEKIISMAVISVIFVALGIVVSRRKKYESL